MHLKSFLYLFLIIWSTTNLFSQDIGVVCRDFAPLNKELVLGSKIFEPRLQFSDSVRVIRKGSYFIQNNEMEFLYVKMISGNLKGEEGWVSIGDVCTDLESYQERITFLDEQKAKEEEIDKFYSLIDGIYYAIQVAILIFAVIILRLPRLFKATKIGDVKFKFHKHIATVIAIEKRTQTDISGGGGSISTSLGNVQGHFNEIRSVNHTITDFWLRYPNGQELNYQMKNFIPIRVGHELTLITNDTNQWLAVRNNHTNGLIKYWNGRVDGENFEKYNPSINSDKGKIKRLKTIYPILSTFLFIVLTFMIAYRTISILDSQTPAISDLLTNIVFVLCAIIFWSRSKTKIEINQNRYKNHLYHFIKSCVLTLVILLISQTFIILPTILENELNIRNYLSPLVLLYSFFMYIGLFAPLIYIMILVYIRFKVEDKILSKLRSAASFEYGKQLNSII